MSVQPSSVNGLTRLADDMVASTRRGVIERMADPYLTDHDRWVLRQFANFLSRLTPDPYPRSMAIGTEGPLPPRARRRRV